ncbi:MAG: cysteine desulfurase [Sphingomonadales bacterium]
MMVRPKDKVLNYASPNHYDVDAVRADFPILARPSNGRPLVFLDSAASAQKPSAVIDAIKGTYENSYANIHRGVYELSQLATEAYEGARRKVRQLINAAHEREIVFVRGATEGINLVAQSFGRSRFREGDEIILSRMEHHSNIVPWQLLRDQIGIKLRVAPINDLGELDVEEYRKLFTDRTRMVAMIHMSNALGTVTPLAEVIDIAHGHGVPVLVDGCQAIPHMPVDVQALDADFYVFSGHKFYGPTGIGVLYAKADLLEAMPPYQGGGEMIRTVAFEHTEYNDVPFKFEAGTPNIVGAIGLGAAVGYVRGIGLERIAAHEKALLDYATARLSELNSVRIFGTSANKGSIISFLIEGAHPHDVGTILDHEGIAVRAGHHCAQPVMEWFGVPATVRASFGMYNRIEDADALIAGVQKVTEIFG